MTAVTARCPSDLALEGYLLQPERSPVTAHLDTCDHCRARVQRMQAEGDDFRQYVFPATVEAVQASVAPRASRWLKFLSPVAALAAVGAAALLVVRVGPVGPSADYVGIKGGGDGLTETHVGRAGLKVFIGDADGARVIKDGDIVPAGAALRFKIKPDDGKCWLWIASVDAKGQISRLYPPQGVAPKDIPAGAVPGGAVLDGQPGLERLFAVCADSAETTWEDVRTAASPAVGGNEALRRTRVLGKPLDDECQSSILLDKR